MRREFLEKCAAAGLLTAMVAIGLSPSATRAANDLMTLSVTSFEAGISYRDVQQHAPIGMIMNPCSQADKFAATIDWGDGSGEHKPDTDIRTRPFSTENKTPVVENGVYLFWDDAHAFARSGTYVAKAKVVLHCLGDPPGDQEFTNEITVNAYARVPVDQVAFTKNGKTIGTAAGHDNVDLTITLDAPAPPSGTWVKLGASPEGTFNSLPVYYRVSPQQTQETIRNLEVRKPSAASTLVVAASTVGRVQETDKLVITP